MTERGIYTKCPGCRRINACLMRRGHRHKCHYCGIPWRAAETEIRDPRRFPA